VGALPGGGFLTAERMPADSFDVEPFRRSPVRKVVVRRPGRPALVLGSTQPAAVVDPLRAVRAGIDVLRRRSGGGAVLVRPGNPVWIDLWVPRGDPLWSDDVVRAAEWVGEWWAAGLEEAGASDVQVHSGGSVASPWSHLICFAGVGPGEVVVGGRKLVGISQWRSREGALFHTCAYRHWDPRPVVDLLDISDADRVTIAGELSTFAAGFEAFVRPSFEAETLLAALPPGPAWDIATS